MECKKLGGQPRERLVQKLLVVCFIEAFGTGDSLKRRLEQMIREGCLGIAVPILCSGHDI